MTKEAAQLTVKLSKTQVDRLGDRLREGSITEADLRILDDYRLSFGGAYETVVRSIREQLQLEPTGRPAKSTSSLVEKLHRESIRLSQVQDIAGCRVVVASVAEQDRVVVSLCAAFPGASVVDRRANPSYGYRAVHVIARISGKLVEIQVRSSLQHLWAELSEKLSDIVDPSIKYGGGNNEVQELLTRTSALVARCEKFEKDFDSTFIQNEDIPEQQRQEFRRQMVRLKEEMADFFRNTISTVEKLTGEKL